MPHYIANISKTGQLTQNDIDGETAAEEKYVNWFQGQAVSVKNKIK